MKYIKDLRDGERVSCIYLCKHRQSAMTKNGKPYDNVVLQDKTGVLDGKIWDPNSSGIDDFDDLDYVEVMGDIVTFAGALQLNIKRVRRVDEGEYDPSDYLPVSAYDIEEMYRELLGYVDSVQNPYLHRMLKMYFGNEKFAKVFKFSSAAKSVHHGFVGGLLEHTLSVTRLCEYYTKTYRMLNRDLLITASLMHDIGKTR